MHATSHLCLLWSGQVLQCMYLWSVHMGHAVSRCMSGALCSWGYALGHTLWSAAPELISFLVAVLPEERLRRSRVVELGAGLGAVGHVR